MNTSIPIDVPAALIASQCKHSGAWIASLPALIANILDRWTLRLDGPARLSAYDLTCRLEYNLTCRSRLGDHGMVSPPATRVRRSLSR
jgi:hypothetical protein